jgi:hypothetical protein
MKFAIVCSGPRWAHPKDWIKQALVEWYDPDFNKGEGRCEFTYDITRAQVFDELGHAVAYAERIPVNHPFTESGMINRPIHCFEIEYRALELDVEKKALQPANNIITPTVSAAQRWDLRPDWRPTEAALREVIEEDKARRS